ncbi:MULTISPECIES: DUF5333 domain-containing protein [Roseobacteraceae]|uniref:DUF5333 domain-containing protein n=1 Tax=Roseobacteraceae TaxID=2854170 RepID=UPI0025C06516|nr:MULTISPECIES: DUF5333 domain-containing protein [Roseobacteraceae]MDF1802817.1 DUF5333 domain-containing protein [Thalassovita sp.]
MRMILPLMTASILASSGMASALPPLREVKSINDGLFAVAVADQIRKECSGISARMFRALNYINTLENHALELGYSKKEIKAYVKSKEEKARMRARGEAYLKANGASYAEPDTFCNLGRAEIAKGSRIGQLLRAK